MMLNDLICQKREELNKSILEGQDYSVTYQISIELDELIAEYYRENVPLGTVLFGQKLPN